MLVDPQRPLRFRLRRDLCTGLLTGGLILTGGLVSSHAQENSNEAGAEVRSGASIWQEKHTRLANQYLTLLLGDPQYGHIVDLLWDLYQKHANTGLLIDHLRAQAQASAEHPQPFRILGHLHRKAGDLSAAREAYNRALEIDPSHYGALADVAATAAIEGDHEARRAALRQLLELTNLPSEERVGVLVNLGHAEVAAGDSSAAAVAWGEALKDAPADLRRTLARAMLSAGLTEEALREFATLAEVEDAEVRMSALGELARLQEHAGEFDAAVVTLREGMVGTHFEDYRHVAFFEHLLRIFERQDRLADLEAELLAAVEAGSDGDPRQLIPVVRFYRETVQFEACEQWLRRLVGREGSDPKYRAELVSVLLDLGRDTEAAEQLDQLLDAGGTASAEMVFQRCEIDFRLAKPEAADARLRVLLSSAPEDRELRQRVQRFAGEHFLDTLSGELLAEALEREPGSGDAAYAIVEFAFERGRDEEARAAVDAFLAGVQPGSVAELARLRDMVSRLLSTDRYGFALELALRASEHPDAGREDLLMLADVRSGLGQREEAMVDLEEAWRLSENFIARVDVDERLLSLLENAAGRSDSEEALMEAADLVPQLFPSVDSFADPGARPGGMEENARGTASVASRQFARSIAEAAEHDPSRPKQLRAAWWATRVGDHAAAYELFASLRFDENGKLLSLPLECERLLLDLAVETGNESLEAQQVKRLLAMDEEGSFEYRKREALLDIRRRFVERGLAGLRLLLEEDPSDMPLLATYTQVLRDENLGDEAASAWRLAFERARSQEISLVGEPYARLLVERGEYGRAAKVLARAMREESDATRRRELAAKQVGFIDLAAQREEEIRFIEALEQEYRGLLQVDPLDPIYHQVLAELYRVRGDAAAAFGAMRQAHYLAPDDPAELPALRDAALEAGDRKAAIYFQRQLLFGRGGGGDLKQWRSLISMLEGELRVDEADRIRARLERQFAQDPGVLSDLATSYEQAGRTADGARVRERLAALRPWDLQERFRHALGAVKAGERQRAGKIFDGLIAELAGERVEEVVFPIDTRRSEMLSPVIDLQDALAETATMKDGDFDVVYDWLGEPHPEFQMAPTEVNLLGLRAIGERARLLVDMGENHGEQAEALLAAVKDRPVELLWAATYLERGAESMQAFAALLATAEDRDQVDTMARYGFVRCLLGLRSQQVGEVLDWVASGADDPQFDDDRRVGIFLAVFQLLTHAEARWRPDQAALQTLATHPGFSAEQRWELVRDLAGASAYREAVAMGDGLLLTSGEFAPNRAYVLAVYANMTGDREAEIKFLRLALEQTVDGIHRTQENLFYKAIAQLHRALPTEKEKAALLEETILGVDEIRNPHEISLRRVFLAGLSGEQGKAETLLSEFYDQLEARGLPGRWTIINHFSPVHHRERLTQQMLSYGEFLKSHQMAPLAISSLAHGEPLLDVELLPDEQSLFHLRDLKRAQLVWELHEQNYPQRQAHILLQTAGMEDAGEINELASRLELEGYHRERAGIFHELLKRAASNSDYAENFLQSCLIAHDHVPALAYLEELKISPASNRPQGLTPDRRDQYEAMFVRMAGDVEGLRREGSRRDPQPNEINPERPPREVYFLNELAGYCEQQGDIIEAAEAYVKVAEWLPSDGDVRLNAAGAYGAAGDHGAAVEQLRVVLRGQPAEDVEIDVLMALAEHLGELEDWEGLRDLLPRAASFRDPGPTIALSQALLKGGFLPEVRSALLLAERRNRDDVSLLRVLTSLLEVTLRPELAGASEPELQRIFREISLLTAVDLDPLENLAGVLVNGRQQVSQGVRESIKIRANDGGAAGAMAGFCALCISHPEDPSTVSLRDVGIEAVGAARDFSRNRSRVGIETLLSVGDPQGALVLWQKHEKRVPSRRSPLRPLHVRIYAALDDETALVAAHAEGARALFPGAPFGTDLPRAFAEVGRMDLALDLYANYERQLWNSGRHYAAFVEEYIALLIAEEQWELAEYQLLRHHPWMPGATAGLLVELYQTWGKLSQLDQELEKFHLASGVLAKVASRVAALKIDQESTQ